MVVKRKPGRLSKNQDKYEIARLQTLLERQDEAIQQSLDEIAQLRINVEFYRKQVNHLIALLNILTKGS